MSGLKLTILSLLMMVFMLGTTPQLSANSSIGNHSEQTIAKGDHHGGHHRGHHGHHGQHRGWGHRGWDGWGGATYYRSYPYYYNNPGYNNYYYYDPYYYNNGSGLYFRFGF